MRRKPTPGTFFMNVTPSQYCSREFPPSSAADFIGGAREAALGLERIIKHALANSCPPLKLFYSGESGVGKTALCYYAERLLGVSRFALMEYNGTDVTIDVVRDLSASLALTCNELFGPYRLIEIHEADRIPDVAQVRLLTVLDNLPSRAAVFCTSNADVGELEKRFHRRFKFTTVRGATSEEISGLLARWSVPPAVANQIAITACGSVALALQEAEEYLQTNVGAAA